MFFSLPSGGGKKQIIIRYPRESTGTKGFRFLELEGMYGCAMLYFQGGHLYTNSSTIMFFTV